MESYNRRTWQNVGGGGGTTLNQKNHVSTMSLGYEKAGKNVPEAKPHLTCLI